MHDVRGDSPGRNGSGEEAAFEDRKPVVLSFGSREPEVRGDLPDPRLPGKAVALTFDDGPDQWTDAILDILEAYEVPATFFCLGEKVIEREKEAQRIIDLGCEIANHTHSHANLSQLSNAEICRELADCSSAIHAVTGTTPYFYRAPFLNDPPAAKMAGLALGMLSVDCDVIAEDWKRTDWREITTRVVNGIKAGGRNVLLHDGVPKDRLGSRKATVKAVGALVPWLLDHDYELVTVSQLLGRVDASESRAGTSPRSAA